MSTSGVIESKLTATEAICWAEEQYRLSGRWPVRRFRVERTPVGNSHLLTEKKAKATHQKYGGTVVELVPNTHGYREYCIAYKRECVFHSPRTCRYG